MVIGTGAIFFALCGTAFGQNPDGPELTIIPNSNLPDTATVTVIGERFTGATSDAYLYECSTAQPFYCDLRGTTPINAGTFKTSVSVERVFFGDDSSQPIESLVDCGTQQCMLLASANNNTCCGISWGVPITFASGTLAQPSCAGQPVTIRGTKGEDELVGTPDRDVISAFGGRDEIKGLGGKDVICGGGGADLIAGGKGADLLLGRGGADELLGGAHRDGCDGGTQADIAKGCEVRKAI